MRRIIAFFSVFLVVAYFMPTTEIFAGTNHPSSLPKTAVVVSEVTTTADCLSLNFEGTIGNRNDVGIVQVVTINSNENEANTLNANAAISNANTYTIISYREKTSVPAIKSGYCYEGMKVGIEVGTLSANTYLSENLNTDVNNQVAVYNFAKMDEQSNYYRMATEIVSYYNAKNLNLTLNSRSLSNLTT